MVNKYGIFVPETCFTCHYKSEAKCTEGSKCLCRFTRTVHPKSHKCNDYIVSDLFNNIGRRTGNVQSPNFIKFKTKYCSEHPESTIEDIREAYNNSHYIF